MGTEITQDTATPVFDATRDIKIGVGANERGFYVSTEGMRTHAKPELRMQVAQGMFLPSATLLMADVAEYIHSKPTPPRAGARVQLAPWTVVEFQYDQNKVDSPDFTIELVDGVRKESFV